MGWYFNSVNALDILLYSLFLASNIIRSTFHSGFNTFCNFSNKKSIPLKKHTVLFRIATPFTWNLNSYDKIDIYVICPLGDPYHSNTN